MSATSLLRKSLVDEITGVAPFTVPAIYLSLHTGDPGDSGSHAFEVSTVSTGYARQPLAGIMSAADAVTGVSVNTSAINFGPALLDWGLITHLGLESALSGGWMLIPGLPSIPKIIRVGVPFQLAAGQLRLRID